MSLLRAGLLGSGSLIPAGLGFPPPALSIVSVALGVIEQDATGTLATVAAALRPASNVEVLDGYGVTWSIATATGAVTASLAAFAALPLDERLPILTATWAAADGRTVRLSGQVRGLVELVQDLDPSDEADQLAGDLSTWTADDGSMDGVVYSLIDGASPSRVAGALGIARVEMPDSFGVLADIDGDVTPSVWIVRAMIEGASRVMRVSHATLGDLEVAIPADVEVFRAYWGVDLAGENHFVGVTDEADAWTEADAALPGYAIERMTRVDIAGTYRREPLTTIDMRGCGVVALARIVEDEQGTGALIAFEARIIPRADLTAAALRTLAGGLPAASAKVVASGTALDAILPSEIAVGVLLDPGTPEQLAEDGPNLLTEAVFVNAPAGVTNRSWVGGDDGYYQFDVSPVGNNHNFYVPAGGTHTAGQVLIVENLAESPADIELRKQVSGNVTVIDASLTPGETHEYTVEAGFERIRCNHLTGQTGTGFRLRIRVKDAIPYVPAVPGVDVDLAAAFTGGHGTLTYEIAGMPAGWTATGAVIDAESNADTGAGADYEIAATTTDARGVSLTLDHAVRVTEPFAVQSVTIVNTDAGAPIVVGSTVTMQVDYRGWPGPFPSNLEPRQYPIYGRAWRDQGNDTIRKTGETWTIPDGVTEARANADFQIAEGVFTGASVDATPVAVGTAAPTAPVVTIETFVIVDAREATIDIGDATGTEPITHDLVYVVANGDLLDGAFIAPAQMGEPSLAGDSATATLTLAAAPAVDGGSVITEYDYQVTTAADTTFAAPVATGAVNAADLATPVVIDPLSAGDYIARNRAVNAIGDGAWSAASSAATVTDV